MKVRKAASGASFESFGTMTPARTPAQAANGGMEYWLELALHAPEMRAERVELLRRAIRTGQYLASTEQLVVAMTDDLLGFEPELEAA